MKLSGAPLVLQLSWIFAVGSSHLAYAGGFLQAREQNIVDASGQKVVLRGVGLGNWMLPEGYMWRFGEEGDRPHKIEKLVTDLIGQQNGLRFWSEFRRRYVTEADIQRIADLGFNCVRPALNSRLFLADGTDQTYESEGFELLDNLIAWCKRHAIYVIIDMHAAPGGQTGANIDDSADDQPRLFMDTRNQDRLVALWGKIATRYKEEPAVAAYDLLNEPLPQRTGAAAKYKDQLQPLYQRLIKAIREIDPRHIITLEGADWANDWSVFTPGIAPNLLYQFHYYCWDRPDKLNPIEKFLTLRQRLNAPIWVGETGEKDNAIYWATTDYLEANNVGWSFWPWKKMETLNTPYSIKPPPGWDQIVACSKRGGAPKPSREFAQNAFDQLLENIRLTNCVYFPGVVNAIFRRVPGKVQAENYGHEGPKKSYFVKGVQRKAEHYRTSEPVPIEEIEGAVTGWHSEQSIRLTAGEWTAYTVNSEQSRSFESLLKARAQSTPALLHISLNEQVQDAPLSSNHWQEIALKPFSFSKGPNRLKLLVQRGAVSIDWLDFH